MVISRQLRKNQTPAEKVFWAAVRRKQFENRKFLRQHPVFYKYHGRDRFFIADFYCRELQLIVEIDGGIHEQQKDYDEIRSEILETQKDLRIIRFTNRQVLGEIAQVFLKLKEFLTHHLPLPASREGPGEGSFFLNPVTNRYYSWPDLLDEINRTKTLKPICYERDYFSIFKSLLLSLVTDTPLTLLDYDFSPGELKSLGITPDLLGAEIPVNPPEYSIVNDLLEALQSPTMWRLTLFTSGTTGLPKKVEHTWHTLTKAVRISENRRADVWGLAYNPTHIAGLQVFFQALLNGNTMVNLFQLPRDTILEQIGQHRITHISATPTFFRLLLPVKRAYNSVLQLTSGGEKFDSRLTDQLQTMFPNARMLNVYASTEAGTLFAARNDVFTIKPETRAYVAVRDDELLIHKDWLARSDAFDLDGDWYRTGDLVEIIGDDPLTFRFLTRRNEMINVGGYKVNPAEVEAVINTYPKVRNNHVFGKPHTLIGNILVCDVQSVDSDISEQELRLFLRDHLQDYKIPRIFNFVKELQTTRSGKLKRE